MLLEVIAKNLDDIIEINKSNADRIEFCIELEHGGLTPKIEDIKMATKISKLPIMVILREHYENFEITKTQLNILLEKIDQIKNSGVKGIVYGGIINGQINLTALKKIMSALGQMEITFHKAFDFVDNFKESSLLLKELGITRVLTSGGKGDPWVNRDNLLLIKSSGIETLIGGGVNINNIEKLSFLGFTNFHIGTAARINDSWNEKIDISKINIIKKQIKI